MELLQLLEHSTTILLSATFVFSLLVGSFLNVVIYRLPKSMQHEWSHDSATHLLETYTELKPTLTPYTQLKKPPSLVWARSHCQNCQHQIKAWENIPVISFLLLRGKCSSCKSPISHRYWLIELLTAILSTFVVAKFGWSITSACAVIITWFLIAIAMIDYDTMVIPDQLSLSLMWLGLFASSWSVFVDPIASIYGALLGYLLLWSVFHVFKLITGKDGMGYGDFKLLAAGGAWLGMQSVAIIVILSSFSGALLGSLIVLIKKSNKPIPFGPYLAVGMWIAMLYGQDIITWYLDFSGLN